MHTCTAGRAAASLGTGRGRVGGLTALHKWHLPVSADGPDQAIDCGISAKAKASHQRADDDEPVGGKHRLPAPHPGAVHSQTPRQRQPQVGKCIRDRVREEESARVAAAAAGAAVPLFQSLTLTHAVSWDH